MQLYLMRWPRWTTGGFSLRRNALPADSEAISRVPKLTLSNWFKPFSKNLKSFPNKDTPRTVPAAPQDGANDGPLYDPDHRHDVRRIRDDPGKLNP